MIHQIKAQLDASLEKIDRTSKIENLCSKLSVTLSMASAVDSFAKTDTFFDALYSQVENYLKISVELIRTFDDKKLSDDEKKEKPTV